LAQSAQRLNPSQIFNKGNYFGRTTPTTVGTKSTIDQPLDKKSCRWLKRLQQGLKCSNISQLNQCSTQYIQLLRRIWAQIRSMAPAIRNLIEVDGKALEDSTKVRLILGKLGDDEYANFTKAILPKKPDEMNYADTIK
jgi:hypothetical protein